MGKGSTQRPTDMSKFAKAYDKIFGVEDDGEELSDDTSSGDSERCVLEQEEDDSNV
jgi:hypothetical protein